MNEIKEVIVFKCRKCENLVCTDKGNVDMQYALGGLSNNIFASKYVTYMPDKEQLLAQVEAVILKNEEKNKK